jgi:hypothetical protein
MKPIAASQPKFTGALDNYRGAAHHLELNYTAQQG